jgi:hypothetical protein
VRSGVDIYCMTYFPTNKIRAMPHIKAKEGVMRSLKKTSIMIGLAGLLALGTWVPLKAAEPPVEPPEDEGFIRRLAADFFNFNNTESSTIITAVAGPDENTPGDPDGEVIFKKKVKVPGGDNTLYVSI